MVYIICMLLSFAIYKKIENSLLSINTLCLKTSADYGTFSDCLLYVYYLEVLRTRRERTEGAKKYKI